MKNLPSPEAFCQYLWHEYLENQNYAILGDCFVPETTVIGTGEHEVSRNLEQFVNKISAEIDARTTAFIIEDQWFQSQWISADSVLVIGELRVREQTGNPLEFIGRFRFTILLHAMNNEWRVLHVHQSVPDPEQGADEFFPHRLMEQSNRQLKQLVEEKTRALEESYRQMEYNARHDSLTQLLNRRWVETQITVAMQEGDPGVMIMLDIDWFKQINDTFGHPLGDQVLETLGQAIQTVFPQALSGRIGGDEFILYLKEEQAGSSALQTTAIEKEAEQLQRVWEELRRQKGLTFPVSASLGAARFPQQGERFDQLWLHADQALYQAKAAGRGCLRFCGEREERD